MKIGEIMHPIKNIESSASVKQAAVMMSEEGIASLIVTKDKKIVGIITEREILKNINKLSSKVDHVMTKKVITIEEDKHIDKAVELMSKNKIKRLPVTREGEVVGIVTATDILANADNINEEFLFD
jgi:predicted transcriptional regulator